MTLDKHRLDVTKVNTQVLMQQGVSLDQGFTEICKKVSSAISKAQSSDQKVVILSGDCDNLAPATIIYHLIDQHKFAYSKAQGHVKERRITLKLIDCYQDSLRDLGNKKGHNSSGIILESKKKAKTSDELTFKDKVSFNTLDSS